VAYRIKKKHGRYNSIKTQTIDGLVHASKMEAERWMELQMLQRAGLIADLRTQVPFELIPTQREPDTIGKRGGIHQGKCLERSVVYIADFVYNDLRTGEEIVEDTKSDATRKKESYIIKRKLMLWVHKIRIHEV
jgi:hypothetical protein